MQSQYQCLKTTVRIYFSTSDDQYSCIRTVGNANIRRFTTGKAQNRFSRNLTAQLQFEPVVDCSESDPLNSSLSMFLQGHDQQLFVVKSVDLKGV